MAISDRIQFKNAKGTLFTIVVKPLSDNINRTVLQQLRRKGFTLAENAGAEEKVALADLTIRALIKGFEVTEGEETRDPSVEEKDALLSFNKVSLEILTRGKALNEELEKHLEIVEGNSDKPSASS